MKKIVFISKKNSNSKKVFDSIKSYDSSWINETEKIKSLNPDVVIVYHWSKIIPKTIYNNFKCVSIHTGNLPDDRGGSPLQNQILRGKKFSRVNLIDVTEPVDSGDVYCSKEISLQGSLNEIWDVIANTTILLLKNFLLKNPKPVPQKGKSFSYKRKTNNKLIIDNIESIHNQIRMLDGDGYPKTFIELNGHVFEFSRSYFENNQIEASVKIFKK